MKIIDATVAYAECETLPTESPGNGPFRRDVLIGGRAELKLVTPLFPGEIKPIFDEVQVIEESGDSGIWSWEVRPSEPGEHRLSLVLTIRDADGKLLEANRRIEIRLNTSGGFGYYAAGAWRGFTSFLVSLEGAVLAAAAIAGAFGGGVLIRKRSRRAGDAAPDKKSSPASPAMDQQRNE